MSVRAKFYVAAIEPIAPNNAIDGKVYGNIKLNPVYSSDPAHENKTFWDATPSGSIVMWINNPSAFAFFADKIGKEFYVDFTVAE